MDKILPLLLELLGKLQEAKEVVDAMADAELQRLQALAGVATMHLLCLVAQITASTTIAVNNVNLSIQQFAQLFVEASLNVESAVLPNIPEEWKLTYVLSKAAESHPAVAFALSWIGPEFPGFVVSIVAIRLFFRR